MKNRAENYYEFIDFNLHSQSHAYFETFSDPFSYVPLH